MRHYRLRGTGVTCFPPIEIHTTKSRSVGPSAPAGWCFDPIGAQCCDCDCHVCVGTGGNCPCLHHLEIHLAKYRGARQSVTHACLNLSCCTVAVVSHVSCLWLGSHWFTLVLVPKNQKFLGCNRGILHQAHVPSNFGKCLYPKRSEVSKSS